jgi:hypothetical protein
MGTLLARHRFAVRHWLWGDAMTGRASTPLPDLPRWYGPRADPGDPAVSALIEGVARGAAWADVGGSFDLRVTFDLDFVRVRERLYDVAASLHHAAPTGDLLDPRRLLDAYERTAPERLTRDEHRWLPGALALIPLHWAATAGRTGDGIEEAERAMTAAEAWWSRRVELSS